MKKSNPQSDDIFSDIASQRISYRAENLIEPAPPILPNISLPVEKHMQEAVFSPPGKMNSSEALCHTLEEYRCRYAPFMVSHAPILETMRCRRIIERFDWRIETNPDRKCFSYVLSGKGKWQEVSIPHYGTVRTGSNLLSNNIYYT